MIVNGNHRSFGLRRSSPRRRYSGYLPAVHVPSVMVQSISLVLSTAVGVEFAEFPRERAKHVAEKRLLQDMIRVMPVAKRLLISG